MLKQMQLLCLLFLVGTTSNTYAQTRQEVVNKHLEAVGGNAYLNKIETIEMDFVAQINMDIIDAYTVMKMPNSAYSQMVMGEQIMVQASDGEAIWRGIKHEEGHYLRFQDVTQEEGLKTHLRPVFISPFLGYETSNLKLTMLLSTEMEGVNVHSITCEDEVNNIKYIAYIDAETYLIRKLVVFKNKNGQAIVEENWLSGYKVVNGHQVAHKVTTKVTTEADKKLLSQKTMNIRSITINGEIDKSLFEKPE